MKTLIFIGLIALISAGTSGCWWGWRHHDEGYRGHEQGHYEGRDQGHYQGYVHGNYQGHDH